MPLPFPPLLHTFSFNSFVTTVLPWLLALCLAFPVQAEPVSLEAGRPAPLFRLPDLDGREFSLETLAGDERVVVILFWGVWCPFCREIMVRLRDLYVELHPEGLEILTVSMREAPHKVRLFTDKLSPAFRVLVDEWAELQKPYEIRDVPRIVILDGDLTVLATRITTSMPIMENMIREAMGMGPKSVNHGKQTIPDQKEEAP